jgi:hypothetical protein
MAPSNLNQVFVVNNVTMLTGSTFATSAATANASKFGIWNIDSAVGPVAAGTYTATDITALRRVQFTQSTLGNVISSPIIDVANIVRINYNGFASDVQTNAIQTWNPAGGTAMVTTKNVMLRIALRTAPTNYESFANPNNLNLDVVGAGGLPAGAKVFPLVGNFAAGRMIFNIEIPAGVNTASATAACDFAKNAIAASPTLSSIFSYNATSTATLVLTARHQGVEFDLNAQYSDGTTPAPGTVAGTRLTPTTNYTQAISAEKSQRARYGNFNRMYFATPQVDYSQPTYAYDMLEIQYSHAWPASTGIARPGEINTLKVFFGSSSTPLAAAANFAAAFGITITSDEERATDVVLQDNI